MANGINLILFISFKKKRMEIRAKIKALINPAMKNGKASIVKYSRFLTSEIKLAPAMIGTAIINVKSEATR